MELNNFQYYKLDLPIEDIAKMKVNYDNDYMKVNDNDYKFIEDIEY